MHMENRPIACVRTTNSRKWYLLTLTHKEKNHGTNTINTEFYQLYFYFSIKSQINYRMTAFRDQLPSQSLDRCKNSHLAATTKTNIMKTK